MRIHSTVAATIMSAALVASAGPAGAAFIGNALEATGWQLDELNGVAVEAATAPEENADNCRSRRQDGTLAPGALLAFVPQPDPPGNHEDW
jgi:hypothetical protein